MYLKITKTGKPARQYLSCVHGYRDAEGKSRSRTVQSFGYVDVLEKEFSDPIAHFKQVVAKMEAARIEEETSVNITIHPKERIGKDEEERKNLGFSVLSKLFYELEIGRFFSNRQTKRKLDYSLASVMRLLVYERILNPGSKLHDFMNKEGYFERFDFSDDDIYRALPIFAHYKDQLLAHLHEQIGRLYGRDTELVYYDVTNTYFEIDEPDDLRKKGVSKEHRPDPIITMGLLLDKDAVPVSYQLFPGNTLDCETLIPQLKAIKSSYSAGRIIVVADKGLCTSDNILACLGKGDGYVISRSVRKGTDELKAWVTDAGGYATKGEDYKSKSRITQTQLKVEDENGKRTRKATITEKQVAFWSQKYADKAKHNRAAAVEKARLMVIKPSKLNSMLDKSAAKYLTGVTYDKDTGEVVETARVLSFNEEKLIAEEALDGYYVICTSEVERPDSEVIDIYRGLWEIEESFKILKSNCKLRPVYVRKEESIEAHFLVCFIALLLTRLLDRRLGYRYPIDQVIESLQKASASHLEDNWWLFDHRDAVIDDVYDTFGIDLRLKYMKKEDTRSLIGATKVSVDKPGKVKVATGGLLIGENENDGAAV